MNSLHFNAPARVLAASLFLFSLPCAAFASLCAGPDETSAALDELVAALTNFQSEITNCDTPDNLDRLDELISGLERPEIQKILSVDARLAKAFKREIESIRRQVSALRVSALKNDAKTMASVAAIGSKAANLATRIASLQSKKDTEPFLEQIVNAVSGVATWPLVGLVAIAVITKLVYDRRFDSILRDLKRLKISATELEVSLNRGDAKKIQGTLHEVFAQYRKQLDEAYATETSNCSISDKINAVLQSVKPKLPRGTDYAKIRCTIHVEDVLFEDCLRQLVDYVPPTGSGRPEAGRIWSTRSRLIGFVWRASKSWIEGDVSPNPNNLIRHWGLTADEADHAGRDRQSFAGILLVRQEVKLGIFYMDHPSTSVFGGNAQDNLDPEAFTLVDLVTSECERIGLLEDLVKIRNTMRAIGPRLKLFG